MVRSQAALAAQELRKELKKVFPATKFKVTSKTYTGGNSVTVSYTDGPTYNDVNKVASKYQAGSFDGMTDMYTYDTRNSEVRQAKYVFVTREYSPSVYQETRDKLVKMYGIENPSDPQEWMKKTSRWEGNMVYTELSDKTLN